MCNKCGNTMGVIGRDIKAYKLAFLCRCGNLSMFRWDKRQGVNEQTAVLKYGAIECPSCGRFLLKPSFVSLTNFAFRITCRCGVTYDAYKSLEHKKRSLGKFASIEDV